MRFRSSALLATALVMTSSVVSAQSQSGQMAVAFAAETERPAPGSTTMLVLRMTPRAGWHGYWRNPGESGGETKLEWDAPKGVVFGRPLWSTPIVSQALGTTSYVMDGAYSLLVPMTLPGDIPVGREFSVGVDVLLFVCTEGMCSSQKVKGSVDLVAGDGSPSEVGSPMIAQARAELPRPGSAKAVLSKDGMVVTVAGVLDPSKARMFVVDPSSPVGAQRGVATVKDGTAFDLGWRATHPFEGVVSDGRVSIAFTARPEKGPVPVVSAAAITRPLVSTRSDADPGRGYVAATAGTHHEPDIEGENVEWSGIAHAAMAAGFLALVGSLAMLLMTFRRRMCSSQPLIGTSAAERPMD